MRLTWDRQYTVRKTVSVASLKLTEVSVKKIRVMHSIECIKVTSKVRREKGVFVAFPSATSVVHWRQNADWSEPRREGKEEVETAGIDNS